MARERCPFSRRTAMGATFRLDPTLLSYISLSSYTYSTIWACHFGECLQLCCGSIMDVNDSGTASRSAAKMGLDFYLDPYRLGVLQDFSVDCDPINDQFDAMRLAFDEAVDA